MMVGAVAVGERLAAERADDHAERAGDEAGKLRGKCLAGRRGEKEEPGAETQHDRKYGALRGRTLPVKSREERPKGADERQRVGVRDEIVDRRPLRMDGVGADQGREAKHGYAHREQLLAIAQARLELAPDAL